MADACTGAFCRACTPVLAVVTADGGRIGAGAGAGATAILAVVAADGGRIGAGAGAAAILAVVAADGGRIGAGAGDAAILAVVAGLPSSSEESTDVESNPFPVSPLRDETGVMTIWLVDNINASKLLLSEIGDPVAAAATTIPGDCIAATNSMLEFGDNYSQ